MKVLSAMSMLITECENTLKSSWRIHKHLDLSPSLIPWKTLGQYVCLEPVFDSSNT